MATVRLALTKPINASLQAKTLDTGAWDVIYFTRIENGKQVGDIERLGKCVNIETAAGDYLSEEFLENANFSGVGHWTTAGGWTIIGGKAVATGNAGYFAQPLLNVKTGATYRVTFTISDYIKGALRTVLYGNNGNHAIGLTRTANGTYVEDLTFNQIGGSSDNTILLQTVYQGTTQDFKTDNVSVKEVVTINSNQYLVDVEVDSTAQTPNDGDFIFFGKENKVNISGVRGYFSEVKMNNDSNGPAKLFSVGSEIAQSSK